MTIAGSARLMRRRARGALLRCAGILAAVLGFVLRSVGDARWSAPAFVVAAVLVWWALLADERQGRHWGVLHRIGMAVFVVGLLCDAIGNWNLNVGVLSEIAGIAILAGMILFVLGMFTADRKGADAERLESGGGE